MYLYQQILLNAVNVNTNGIAVDLATSYNNDRGCTFIVAATNFGGGTVNIEVTPDNGTTWVPLRNPYTGQPYTFTANGTNYYPRSLNLRIRATLTGASGASAVSAYLM